MLPTLTHFKNNIIQGPTNCLGRWMGYCK